MVPAQRDREQGPGVGRLGVADEGEWEVQKQEPAPPEIVFVRRAASWFRINALCRALICPAPIAGR